MIRNGFVVRSRFFMLVALLLAAPAVAGIAPAEQTAGSMPDVQVLNSAGASVSIQSVIAATGSGPIVILPIYTRCGVSCPLQTQKIKQVWKDLNRTSSLRVIVFSFDPQETAASISDYRRREGVPDDWAVVHSSESDARAFFDFFHYSVMSDDGQFVHPDRIFLLDSSSHWRFTMDGLNYAPEDIERALAQLQSPGLLLWIRTNPSAVAWTGFLFILVSLSLLGIWRVGHHASGQPSASRNPS